MTCEASGLICLQAAPRLLSLDALRVPMPRPMGCRQPEEGVQLDDEAEAAAMEGADEVSDVGRVVEGRVCRAISRWTHIRSLTVWLITVSPA